ncbi:hypothetical protein [Actinomadura rupiterrae]|uniref:hypothetical protein n=1 Tax=Actinomadura rupiterrae TaxID=559627 RepID=UPI0020A56ECA|nr:hypothetical protein [Actinomadura rupiterrae]
MPLALMLVAAYMTRDAMEARLIVAELSEDELRELEAAVRELALWAPTDDAVLVDAGPSLGMVAEVTGLDCEAIIDTVLLLGEYEIVPEPQSVAEWAALAHLEAAIVATLLVPPGTDPEQKARFLRERASTL